MQQWEYLFVTQVQRGDLGRSTRAQAFAETFAKLQRGDLDGSTSAQTFANGEALGVMGYSGLFRYSNEMGAKGWEMIACNNIGQIMLFLVFKRPIVEPENWQQ